MSRISVEGGMQLQERAESANHRDAGPKGKGKNTVLWAETSFPLADLSWTQHGKLSGNLLSACTGSVAAMQVVL